MTGGLPRTRRSSVHASRNLSGRLRRHCVIGCTDPGQNPSAVRSGSSRVRGRGLDRVTTRSLHRAGLASVLTTRTLRSASGTPAGDASPASRPCHEAVAWRARTWCCAPGMAAAGRKGRGAGIGRSFACCKPICKPDAARQLETRETEPTERDGICPVRRGHYARERRPETSETNVVWLITQRSRVQIPPPLPRQRPSFEQEEGLWHVVC